nr:MAG TPA: hypothetical protein [Caudoviricetes sp.]
MRDQYAVVRYAHSHHEHHRPLRRARRDRRLRGGLRVERRRWVRHAMGARH